MAERFDPREVKARLPMLELFRHLALPHRKSGPRYVASCPFHQEKSDSFTLYEDHGYCFGCGKAADVIAVYGTVRGVDFKTSLEALAALVSLPPGERECVTPRRQVAKVLEPRVKPELPEFKPLRDAGVLALAGLRSISMNAVFMATDAEMVFGGMWPPWDPFPCWVVTDSTRNVAQFRRLDGKLFERRDDKPIKCWTKGSPTWPLGASEMGEKSSVLLVEGGADMLAAFHFLHSFDRLESVAVVAMLGASMRMAEDALPFFLRKRVRIILDNDEAGTNAAARWTEQLTAAGAAVESFSLAGLTRKDGEPVKDLNDLALVEEAAWLDPELRAAFLDFDF